MPVAPLVDGWVLLLDRLPDLRLLALGSVLGYHSECHPRVADVVDRVSPLSGERELAGLELLPLLRR